MWIWMNGQRGGGVGDSTNVNLLGHEDIIYIYTNKCFSRNSSSSSSLVFEWALFYHLLYDEPEQQNCKYNVSINMLWQHIKLFLFNLLPRFLKRYSVYFDRSNFDFWLSFRGFTPVLIFYLKYYSHLIYINR